MKIKLKIFQFFQFGVVGVWGFYLPLLLSQRGFSGIQIGLILGTMPIVVMSLQPVWSFLSDRLNTRKKLLLISCLGMGITMFGIGLFDSFIMTLIWTVLFSVFYAPLYPISAALLLESLEETDELEKFSEIRLWGSVGFGIISLVVGSLFLGENINYTPWLAGGLYFFLGLLSIILPEKRGEILFPQEKLSQILMGNPRLIFYLLGSVFIGASFGVYNNTISLFMKFLNAQDWLIGLAISLQAFVEVPFMYFTPLILKYRSQRWAIMTGALLLLVRWLIYLFIQTPGWIFPLQLIHGMAVVSFQVIGISFVDQLINPRWRATGQGLYASALSGLGVALGVYLAGPAMEWYGIHSVWLLNIIFGVIGLVFLIVAFNSKHQDQEHAVVISELSKEGNAR